MVRALIASVAVMLSSSPAPVASRALPAGSKAKVTAASYQLSPNIDAEAERQLLDLANQSRAQAGLSPLQPDDGLTQAARAHAAEMADQQQLSHQLPGEPSLSQRLAAASTLHLEGAGENVAYASTVNQAEDTLMASPPHRENLLNPAYNVAGFGVVRSGNTLYVAQDFGRSLRVYSPQIAGDLVAATVDQIRQQDALPVLQRRDGTSAASSACAMAKANSLNAAPLDGRYLLRYTSMQPGTLPSGAEKVIADRSLRAFAVGTCYATSASYPNGAYWVTLLFY